MLKLQVCKTFDFGALLRPLNWSRTPEMDPKWSPQCQRFQYSILNVVHISDDYGLLVGIEVYQAWGCKFVRERNLVAQVLSSQFSNLPELNPWVLCVSWV